METITPDNWVLIKVHTTSDAPYYKVFGEWSGSYAYGTSWRMNSGITKVTEDDRYYYFEGLSGSVYRCSKKRYGIRTAHSAGVLSRLTEEATEQYGEGVLTIVSEDGDFTSFDYGVW